MVARDPSRCPVRAAPGVYNVVGTLYIPHIPPCGIAAPLTTHNPHCDRPFDPPFRAHGTDRGVDRGQPPVLSSPQTPTGPARRSSRDHHAHAAPRGAAQALSSGGRPPPSGARCLPMPGATSTATGAWPLDERSTDESRKEMYCAWRRSRRSSPRGLYQCQGETRMVRSAAHGDLIVALV
jgi:hypothetical protein